MSISDISRYHNTKLNTPSFGFEKSHRRGEKGVKQNDSNTLKASSETCNGNAFSGVFELGVKYYFF